GLGCAACGLATPAGARSKAEQSAPTARMLPATKDQAPQPSKGPVRGTPRPADIFGICRGVSYKLKRQWVPLPFSHSTPLGVLGGARMRTHSEQVQVLPPGGGR